VNIDKPVTTQTLRHSITTHLLLTYYSLTIHLLQSGEGIRTVQDQLGHVDLTHKYIPIFYSVEVIQW